MDELACIPESESIYLAPDMEWSVDRANGIYGRVAVVSLAFEKYSNICVSPDWDNTELSESQKKYATLDVYAAWCVYQSLTQFAVEKQAIHMIELQPWPTASLHQIVLCISTVSNQINSLTPFPLLFAGDVQVTTEGILTPGINTVTSNCSAPLPPLPHISAGLESSELGGLNDDPVTDLVDDAEIENWLNDLSFDAEKEESPLNAPSDEVGVSRAQEIIPATVTFANTEVHSHVWLDVWHLMNQLKISLHHGLRRPFFCALRDALFIPDADDKAAVEAVLKKQNDTWDQMVLWRPAWIWSRVKRLVPRSDILHQRVSKVFYTFGPLKDSSGKILFDHALWLKAENILKNIHIGTNHVEGGVHQNIVCHFGSYNAGPRLAVKLICDYCLYHNLKVGTLNRTGCLYSGSYDIWTLNKLARLCDQIQDAFSPDLRPITWVNGNDYEPSSETFGILPLSEDTQSQLGMLEFHSEFAIKEQLPEHLKNYYKAWIEYRNEKNAIEQNCDAYNQLQLYLIPNPDAIPAVPVAALTSLACSLSAVNKLPTALADPDINKWEIANLLGPSLQPLCQLHTPAQQNEGPNATGTQPQINCQKSLMLHGLANHVIEVIVPEDGKQINVLRNPTRQHQVQGH
ncbi:hypothetical protein H0H92_001158 [Tricholoma furcatifolium]|nr:hypothetical protein H0H92_001158 [Tricholoma furcatifolium]